MYFSVACHPVLNGMLAVLSFNLAFETWVEKQSEFHTGKVEPYRQVTTIMWTRLSISACSLSFFFDLLTKILSYQSYPSVKTGKHYYTALMILFFLLNLACRDRR